MIISIHKSHNTLSYRIFSAFIAFTFIFSLVLPPGYAQLVPASPAGGPQTILNLPAPGTMVTPTAGFTPALINGITIHPENPLEFDFIVGTGDDKLQGKAFEDESTKLIKYFLASLTVPEDEMWVNLSPYEKDRIIPSGFGTTEMGRDLLAQDYILKQLTASLMYPEKELGSEFWKKIYQKAREQYGTTEIPVNTFNKVWIVPEKAIVYEHGNSAFVVKSRLKVMLEQDYVAMQHNLAETPASLFPEGKQQGLEADTRYQSEIIKEVILPAIEKEVNEGKGFANLRQIYHSAILAAWFKQNLRQTLLGQVYVDKAKTKGVDVEDKMVNQKIYAQYLEAFKKGVYNYIKEDIDPATQEIIPRKYFSGGTNLKVGDLVETYRKGESLTWPQQEIVGEYLAGLKDYNQGMVRVNLVELSDDMSVVEAWKLIQESQQPVPTPAEVEKAKEDVLAGIKEAKRLLEGLSAKVEEGIVPSGINILKYTALLNALRAASPKGWGEKKSAGEIVPAAGLFNIIERKNLGFRIQRMIETLNGNANTSKEDKQEITVALNSLQENLKKFKAFEDVIFQEASLGEQLKKVSHAFNRPEVNIFYALRNAVNKEKLAQELAGVLGVTPGDDLKERMIAANMIYSMGDMYILRPYFLTSPKLKKITSGIFKDLVGTVEKAILDSVDVNNFVAGLAWDSRKSEEEIVEFLEGQKRLSLLAERWRAFHARESDPDALRETAEKAEGFAGEFIKSHPAKSGEFVLAARVAPGGKSAVVTTAIQSPSGNNERGLRILLLDLSKGGAGVRVLHEASETQYNSPFNRIAFFDDGKAVTVWNLSRQIKWDIRDPENPRPIGWQEEETWAQGTSSSPVAKVLIVDDNSNLLSDRKTILERNGHTVTTANDGAEAFQVFQESSFDLVLTDYEMPNLDGPGLISKIRAYEKEQSRQISMPIIMVSADITDEKEEKAQELGVPLYSKVLGKGELRNISATVEEALKQVLSSPVAEGLRDYLRDRQAAGEITPEEAEFASRGVKNWLTRPGYPPPLVAKLRQLIAAQNWAVITEGFYKVLPFGTAGKRGTQVDEQGDILPGSNYINDYTVAEYTLGLARYLLKTGQQDRGVVLGGDTRIKSILPYRGEDSYVELQAKILRKMGIKVYRFKEPRSIGHVAWTTVANDAASMEYNSASHNMWTDNGVKASNEFGAQLFADERAGILEEIKGVEPEDIAAMNLDDFDLEGDRGQNPGMHVLLGSQEDQQRDPSIIDADTGYIEANRRYVEDIDVIREYSSQVHSFYTPIQGAGVYTIPNILTDGGDFEFQVVLSQEQRSQDTQGRFGTVEKPDPNYVNEKTGARTLDTALREAEEIEKNSGVKFDFVFGTDPDADRSSYAVRDREGKWKVLKANDVWSLFAWYRLTQLARQGKLKDGMWAIETWVTTDLIVEIVQDPQFNLKVLKPAVGFNKIAEVALREIVLPVLVKRHGGVDLKELQMSKVLTLAKLAGVFGVSSRKEMMEEINAILKEFLLFGAEESNGYSPGGHTLEKDGAVAAVTFHEIAAFIKYINHNKEAAGRGDPFLGSYFAAFAGKDLTINELLNRVYLQYGYYATENIPLTFDGLTGKAQKDQVLQKLAGLAAKAKEGKAVMLGDKWVQKAFSGKEQTSTENVQFDEVGYKFMLTEKNYIVTRPSGTEPYIRLYGQKHIPSVALNWNNIEAQKRKADDEITKTVLAVKKAYTPASSPAATSQIRDDEEEGFSPPAEDVGRNDVSPDASSPVAVGELWQKLKDRVWGKPADEKMDPAAQLADGMRKTYINNFSGLIEQAQQRAREGMRSRDGEPFWGDGLEEGFRVYFDPMTMTILIRGEKVLGRYFAITQDPDWAIWVSHQGKKLIGDGINVLFIGYDRARKSLYVVVRDDAGYHNEVSHSEGGAFRAMSESEFTSRRAKGEIPTDLEEIINLFPLRDQILQEIASSPFAVDGIGERQRASSLRQGRSSSPVEEEVDKLMMSLRTLHVQFQEKLDQLNQDSSGGQLLELRKIVKNMESAVEGIRSFTDEDSIRIVKVIRSVFKHNIIALKRGSDGAGLRDFFNRYLQQFQLLELIVEQGKLREIETYYGAGDLIKATALLKDKKGPPASSPVEEKEISEWKTIFLTHSSRFQRTFAAHMLGELLTGNMGKNELGQDVVNTLIVRLKEEEDSGGRLGIVLALGKIGGEEAAAALRDTMVADERNFVRDAARDSFLGLSKVKDSGLETVQADVASLTETNKTILVLDPRSDREGTIKDLINEGYAAVGISTAGEVLGKIKEGSTKIPLVIVEINVFSGAEGEKDFGEFLEDLRKESPLTKVIVYTHADHIIIKDLRNDFRDIRFFNKRGGSRQLLESVAEVIPAKAESPSAALPMIGEGREARDRDLTDFASAEDAVARAARALRGSEKYLLTARDTDKDLDALSDTLRRFKDVVSRYATTAEGEITLATKVVVGGIRFDDNYEPPFIVIHVSIKNALENEFLIRIPWKIEKNFTAVGDYVRFIAEQSAVSLPLREAVKDSVQGIASQVISEERRIKESQEIRNHAFGGSFYSQVAGEVRLAEDRFRENVKKIFNNAYRTRTGGRIERLKRFLNPMTAEPEHILIQHYLSDLGKTESGEIGEAAKIIYNVISASSPVEVVAGAAGDEGGTKRLMTFVEEALAEDPDYRLAENLIRDLTNILVERKHDTPASLEALLSAINFIVTEYSDIVLFIPSDLEDAMDEVNDSYDSQYLETVKQLFEKVGEEAPGGELPETLEQFTGIIEAYLKDSGASSPMRVHKSYDSGVGTVRIQSEYIPELNITVHIRQSIYGGSEGDLVAPFRVMEYGDHRDRDGFEIAKMYKNGVLSPIGIDPFKEIQKNNSYNSGVGRIDIISTYNPMKDVTVHSNKGIWGGSKDGDLISAFTVWEKGNQLNRTGQEIITKYEKGEFSSSPIEESVANPGGIDLNPALLDLQIKRDGNGVPLPLPMQPIEHMRIEGFLPIIINVTPVTNLPFLLGLADTEQDADETTPAMKAREPEEVSYLN